MISRDRVLCALNREVPDRVPTSFGTSGATTMLAPRSDRLKAHLGLDNETQVILKFSYALQRPEKAHRDD